MQERSERGGLDVARSRPLVLVVDDDPDLRQLAVMQLGDAFEVIEAAGGGECISLAETTRPDVILLDMMMPGMTGSEVLAALAENPKTGDIPVIFLSSLSRTEDKVRAIDQGAVDFISKPAEPAEVIARVGLAARMKARQDGLRKVGTEDGLTGLPDRKAFEARVAQEAARAHRIGTPFAILILDIDQMKSVNDRYGAGVGDRTLTRIAKSLATTLRTSDVLFRYGGDEFAALLPDADSGAASLAAERCIAGIASVTSHVPELTVSIGVAEMSSNRSHEELIAKAEIALFRAKESGGNRYWRADDMRRHSLSPVALAGDLTEREWSLLGLLANQRTEQEIAGTMGIRPGTVRSHKARIRRKLQVDPDVRLTDYVKVNFRDLVVQIDVTDERLEDA
jgi:diguanylate cyclase (GGDEF)-like protein